MKEKLKRLLGKLPTSYETTATIEWWKDQYSKGHHDYLSGGRTAEIGRYGVIIGYLMLNNVNGQVIDCGCGKALLGQFISKIKGISYTGVEYLPEVVIEARSNVPEGQIIEADLRNGMPDLKNVSAIIFNESLYYFDNYLSVFKAAFDKLFEKGILIVSMYSTPVNKRIWKDIICFKSPTERIAVCSTMGKEHYEWHIAFWVK